jgi:hypothetical protein
VWTAYRPERPLIDGKRDMGRWASHHLSVDPEDAIRHLRRRSRWLFALTLSTVILVVLAVAGSIVWLLRGLTGEVF